jgi:hypothetical protein
MQWQKHARWAALTAGVGLVLAGLPANAAGHSMAVGVDGWEVDPIWTVGETLNGYTPPGVLDGLGAFELDADTVRVLANHELLHFRGYPFTVDGIGLTGARISYFDIDRDTRQVIDTGLAINSIYDVDGELATDTSFIAGGLAGFSRFCSGSLFEAHEFGGGRGLEDRLYMAGEEDGGFFNPTGGAEWALDPATGDIWHLPDLGRGAWENVTYLDTGDTDTIAVLLGDDTSPFDFDDDGVREAAPLFLYVGEKDPDGDLPARNGLRGGDLYVWVASNGATSPADFRGTGSLGGKWVEVDNSRNEAMAGQEGFDDFGYPNQGNLWLQAEELGAFGFSRPEDVATSPDNGRVAVIASTGVDNYVGGVDTFGTTYTLKTNFENLSATLRIIYDGDADPARTLRSPDNLDWADDGRIYIQEDEAEEQTLDGEPLWGPGAANPNEAGAVRMTKNGKKLERLYNIDRSVVLDPTTTGTPVDQDAGNAGEWETSGIVDVSSLFGEKAGTLFLIDVQAHGIEDQDDFNADSRITDGDLVEGGQLSFLLAPDG